MYLTGTSKTVHAGDQSEAEMLGAESQNVVVTQQIQCWISRAD